MKMIKVMLMDIMFLCFATAIIVFLNSCQKTYRVKIDTTTGLDYIEPEQCKIRDINKIQIKSSIENGKITFTQQEMSNLLNNIVAYKQAVKEYQDCSLVNEKYYKNVISILIGENK